MTTKRQAWHFLYNDWRTGYDKLLVKIGEKLVYSGQMPPIPEFRGLHASERLIDALQHANGSIVTFVECEGTVVDSYPGDTKFVCTERTALWGYDATDELRLFSRLVAKEAIVKFFDEEKFGKMPQVVLEWLESGNDELRNAARSAAESAAESTAWSAAGSAAYSAAYSAAESAAWSAARSATNSAAYSAAWSATNSAAWSAQNETLTSMIIEGAKKRGLL